MVKGFLLPQFSTYHKRVQFTLFRTKIKLSVNQQDTFISYQTSNKTMSTLVSSKHLLSTAVKYTRDIPMWQKFPD